MDIAKSTRRTYEAGVRKYLKFCSRYTLHPWPASETTLHYFCVHAYRTITHQSIRVYLSGLRQYHIEHGFRDPLVDMHLLDYLCKGIRRHQGDTPLRRPPITLTLLKNLRRQIRGSSTIKKPDKHMYWAAMTLAFYGFLRANEFCSPTAHKFSKTRILCRGDIMIVKDLAHMSVRVKASKTDQFRCSTTIQVAATHTSTCPVQAMGHYMKRTSRHGASKPLFILKGGHYLTRSHFTSVVRNQLARAGYTEEATRAHQSLQQL